MKSRPENKNQVVLQKEYVMSKNGFFFLLANSFLSMLLIFITRVIKDLSERNILWTGDYVLKNFLPAFFIGIALGIVISFLAYLIRFKLTPFLCSNDDNFKTNPVVVGVIAGLLQFISWIPAFLAFYPGIMNYDTFTQLFQILDSQYSTHHPLIHTLYIKMCCQLGISFWGSAQKGMALHSVLQMLFLASVFAFSIGILYRYLNTTLKTKKVITIAICLVFTIVGIICPFNPFLVLSVTKDIPFSGFFLLLVVCLLESFSKERNELKPQLLDILIVVSATGTVVFRNNAKYPLILFALLCFGIGIVKRKKNDLRIAIFVCFGYIVGMVILIGAAKLTNAEPGNKREMLSVPIQQMARTIYYHGGVNAKDEMGLTNEEWNYINDLFVQGAYTIYQEGISDPVKDLTNTELILNSKRNFLRIYGKLALQYPSDYINAILTLNAGFLSPIDITHANLHAMYNTSGLSYIAIRWNGEEYINYYIGIYKGSITNFVGFRISLITSSTHIE